MRSYKLFFYGMALAAMVLGFAACSKDDGEPFVPANDKGRLKAVIDSLQGVYDNAAEGIHPGQYATGAKADLDSVMQLGKQVFEGNTFSQQQVNNAVQNLLFAGETFKGRLLQEVSAENLMALWKFNGNANDSSGREHHGLLKTGWIGSNAATVTDGGTLPVLTQDRFGRPDMAYSFSNGAYIEVPYSPDLNPQSITISAWIKRTATSPGNYLLSLDRWNGYKFQLQSDNFLFFTFHDTNNGYHDIDNNPGAVPQNVWTQVAITYSSGSMKFYLNGSLSKAIDVTGVPVTVSGVNLAIGNELPKSLYNFTDTSDPNYFWGANYFAGSMDDIRIYNTALSAAEILSIFTQENTLE